MANEPANRILVVHAKHEPFWHVPYVIHLLADEWRSRGIPVEVTDSLTEAMGADVLVFPHLDLTLTPPRLGQQLSRCARVLNRAVTDISKRTISRQLVASPDDYDGDVIVKTNLNFGGWPETRLLANHGGEAARQLDVAWREVPWTVSGMIRCEQYPIYDNPRKVPPRVWKNERLVVEKFLPEREGDLYCLRQYTFLGASEINTRAISEDPRVKSRGVVRREILDSTPAAVRAFREELGFDYGKFDYVMHGDDVVIFDVNRTFTYDPESKAGSVASLLMKLADGIEPFLGSK
ncbi:MAG TPA: hypothetical protein VK192_11040 [Sphingomicrobium sp.]|nr:hypothetical protein [Sphingomicrobium sp.]